jgi:hypothetical protein
MLHGIGECEEVAASRFKTVAQGDQLLPAVNRNQPTVLEITGQFFGLEAKIDNVRTAPNERMERFYVGASRSVSFAAIDTDGASLTELDPDDPRSRICAKKHRVFLEFHESTNLSVIPNEVEESLALPDDSIPAVDFRPGTVDSAKIAEYNKKEKELPSLDSSRFAPVPESTIRIGLIGITTGVLELMKK